ncbi:MAG: NAD(P)H-binding protein, partial [Halioglobus sp.]|nr:NAD(P)H-binding protein [Halioglobus sp.]
MAKYPVVVYGASGYTGMLTMDWLIDQNIPFTAVARDAKRVKEMMAQRVMNLESATYEIVEADHTVEALTKAFKGAKVVCNTVGPFIKFGLVGVEAALKAGCHHLDTTGEQMYVRQVRDQFGELFRQAGLLVSPSLSYMYTNSEIAAELALETTGIDALETAALCRGPRDSAGVSIGSAASIFELFRNDQCYLWENKLVPHPVTASFNIVDPNFIQPVFSLPWSGTSLPVYFEHDSRVRSCISSVGFYDNQVMPMVHQLSQKWDAEYKHLPMEQQDEVVKGLVASTTPTMPPRERGTLQRSVDVAIGRGNMAAVRATVHGVAPYIST